MTLERLKKRFDFNLFSILEARKTLWKLFTKTTFFATSSMRVAWILEDKEKIDGGKK